MDGDINMNAVTTMGPDTGPDPGPGLAAPPPDVSAQIAAQLAQQMALPPLREDLQLHPGSTQKDGSPSWTIEDPLRGRFFRIGWLEFEVLQRWHLGDARQVTTAVAQETLLTPSLEEVMAVKQFFAQHQLIAAKVDHASQQQAKAQKGGLAKQALHHYLMIRIPLVNPDRFLSAMLWLAKPLLSKTAFWASVWAGLLGLVFVAQQWESFTSTFVETLSLSGLLSYGLALSFAKVLHELGHAFTAKKLGLRVPRMGVAIVLLLPMLYTDTGETWRLTRQQDRFSIAVAGIRIELMVAAWCTLAWSFLPEGGLRSAMFFLATTSWLITLAINASPFMRFDGYYMMSDATGIPNLHDEAGKVMKHALRKHLLGFREPPPLVQGQEAPHWLLAFGLTTAIYRFFLFLGIAVTVYHYFFKLLGIFLFAVEIWWFIVRPIYTELKSWWEARSGVSWHHITRTALALALVVAALVVPWQSSVHAEGWIRAGEEYTLYPPRPATLESLRQTATVLKGQSLADLASPELALREAKANARISALDSRLQGGPVPGKKDAESARSTRQQRQQQQVEVSGAGAEADQLHLTAPFDGSVVDMALDVGRGQVLGRREVLARVIDPSTWLAEVFVNEDDIRRVELGAKVKAYVHGLDDEALDGRVIEIDAVPIEDLPVDMLAARYGGKLVTTDDPERLKPRRSLYRLRVALKGTPGMQQARLAAFAIDGERMSFADTLWRGLVSSLVLQVNF